VEWLHLVHDKSQWQALVNTIMNLGPIKGGEFTD
jgi:hypothetical protein